MEKLMVPTLNAPIKPNMLQYGLYERNYSNPLLLSCFSGINNNFPVITILLIICMLIEKVSCHCSSSDESLKFANKRIKLSILYAIACNIQLDYTYLTNETIMNEKQLFYLD